MVEPYLLHFVVTNLTYTPTATGYIVTCYTNNPCHLWLRWTNIVPQQHVNTKIVRGAPVGTYIDQCFVVYTDVEQNEPGDTLTHTFTLEPWPYCETRWFYFWGTVSGQLSPSASCIFTKHSEICPFMTFNPHKLTGGDSVDGHVRRVLAAGTWSDVHDGAGTHLEASLIVAPARIEASGFSNLWNYIARLILTFPTTTLPPTAIVRAATLTLWVEGWENGLGGSPTIAIFHSYPLAYNYIQLEDYQRIFSIPLSALIPIPSLVPGTFITLPLTKAGLAYVYKNAPTTLAIREATYDAPNVVPPWVAAKKTYASFAMSETATPAHKPTLTVYYTLT